MLQALAHHADGDRDLALGVARPGADSCARAGEPRPAVPGRGRPDAGPAARCRRVRRPQPVTTSRSALGRVGCSSTRTEPVEGAGPQQSLADPLSQRELEVLRLLDSELTGPQIAGELYVSLNTLRTHTKRIFTKLDVKTRAAAVRAAHEHGLL